MADDDYSGPDAWIDKPGTVPWGEADYDSAPDDKKDSIRKSWWGTNRASNAAWMIVRDPAKGLPSVFDAVASVTKALAAATTELVRIRTYVGRIEAKVDALAAKLDKPAQ